MLRTVLKRSGKVFTWFIGVVAVLALVGFVFQNGATKANAPDLPPGGRMVDVGDYRLFLQTSGTKRNGPTVVFDSGYGTAASTADWSRIVPDVAKVTQVVTYDRAGYGFSDDTGSARTSERLAEDLHTLLRKADVPGPYLLVGHSLGGFTVRTFAQQYPDEVAGAVLIDAAQEDGPREEMPLGALLVGRKVGLVRALGAVGLYPPVGNAEKFLEPADAGLIAELTYARMSDAAQRSEFEEAFTDANRDQLRATRTAGFGDKPLVVVTSSRNVQANPQWGPLQEAQLKLSSRARQVVVDSGHYVHWEQPQSVIDAIAEVAGQAPTLP
ncbi:alpha/beta fold hydrolase [Actinoplanes sp. NPDC051859]|uniref:alpha/beta fold hydrolase n=1 Tax=Actinoplanes sp. NPDC051859 TaxID=3363909 RepID=UPI0037BB07D9